MRRERQAPAIAPLVGAGLAVLLMLSSSVDATAVVNPSTLLKSPYNGAVSGSTVYSSGRCSVARDLTQGAFKLSTGNFTLGVVSSAGSCGGVNFSHSAIVTQEVTWTLPVSLSPGLHHIRYNWSAHFNGSFSVRPGTCVEINTSQVGYACLTEAELNLYPVVGIKEVHTGKIFQTHVFTSTGFTMVNWTILAEAGYHCAQNGSGCYPWAGNTSSLNRTGILSAYQNFTFLAGHHYDLVAAVVISSYSLTSTVNARFSVSGSSSGRLVVYGPTEGLQLTSVTIA